MIERKTWDQMSKGERIGGTIGLGVIILVAVVLISSLASAIGSMSNEPKSVEQAITAEPVTTYKDIQETEVIPFEKVSQNDASRDVGTDAVTTPGVNGVQTKTYHVTYVDGLETARVQTKDEVTTSPVSEVNSVGTRVPYVPPTPGVSSNCDPNYSGCVPIASDVDCIGGSGNGPAYTGAVQVIGSDIYGLDRDGDGWGCE